jgi:hypothetical protein
MDYDREKVNEIVLALLYLTSSPVTEGARAWKGLPLEVLNNLVQKGYISDNNSKTPILTLSAEGARLSKELFFKYFNAKE